MKQYRTMFLQASYRGPFLVILLVVLFFSTVRPLPVSAAGCSNGPYCTFLPVLKSPASGDLIIQGIEVTQAIQDPQNSVPLVAGRTSLLRIYARTDGSSIPFSNVKISVSASGNYLLSDVPQAYSATVPLTYDRTSMQGSINITLPQAWTDGTVNLVVRLDPDNLIYELSEANNTISRQFTFQAVPPLRIKIVPVRFINNKDGYTYAAPTQDSISSWIGRTYPVPSVEVTWHAPYTFKGDLSQTTEYSRLLNEITALKGTEGAPEDVVYYGLVPTSDSGRTWFRGGVAGIGWIGMRAAVGLDIPKTSGEIAAHEIGHNMGLEHSPCGLLSEANTNYPYIDGSIGQLGTDAVAGVIYPTTTKDVMSYCAPKWVSDYTYRALFQTQRLQGALYSLPLTEAAQSQRGLLVRAAISETGVALKPAYVIPSPINRLPEPGEYMLEMLDAQGAVVRQTALRAYEALSQDDVHYAAINAVVPLPDAPVAAFRLVKDGQVAAVQTLQANVEAAALRAGGAQETLAASGLAGALEQVDRPALVRYSTDGGATWTTMGIDLMAGELPTVPEGARGGGVIYQVLAGGTPE